MLDAGGDPRTAVTGVFSWSYRQLSAPAARTFRLLGLHLGAGWDTYAAAAITGSDLAQVERVLDILARAHLISRLARVATACMTCSAPMRGAWLRAGMMTKAGERLCPGAATCRDRAGHLLPGPAVSVQVHIL